jgi:signal transduction histidine kinase
MIGKQVFLFSSIGLVGLSLFLIVLIFRYGKTFVQRIWGYFNVFIIIWGIGAILVALSKTPQEAIFAWRVGIIGAILTAVTFFHFSACFHNFTFKKLLLKFVYIQGAIFVLLDVVGRDIYINETYELYGLHYLKATTLSFYLSYLLWVIILTMGFYGLLRAFFIARGFKRAQMSYLVVGTTIGWLGAITYTLPFFGIKIYPLGNFTIPLYCLIVTYGILKYRLLDIKVTITRTGIALTVYTLFFGLPFYLGYKTNSWLLSTSSAILLAIPAPFIKAENVILAQQRRYQKILLQAAEGMVTEHNLDRLLKLIVYVVKKTVKPTFAAIFSHDRENKVYVLKAVRDRRSTFPGIVFDQDSPLIFYLRNNYLPHTKDEMPVYARNYLEKELRIPFDLIVPSIIEDEVLGFLILGEKLDKSAYTQDDINVFKILSHQAALAIENCLFLEEFKKVQQQLFQAEKLASIGGIADGVAHQIKNRLNHFSLASGELKMAIKDFIDKNPNIVKEAKLKELFDYFMQIADSLSRNVKRTDGIIRGILNFARTTEKDTYFGWCSLEEMIKSSLNLILIKHEVASIPVEVNLNSIDMIWGVKSQLNEVIYNLTDNSYEATQMLIEILSPQERENYQPKIRIEAKEEPLDYLIIISDNGIGIKEEDKRRIFAPFFTTKASYKSGSGIGMYVVRRIVEENHKGKIWFESQYKKGTTFYIRLPKPKKSLTLNKIDSTNR